MSAADDLRALVSGRRPARPPLQNARLEAGGADFYGEEAVGERCRAAPVDLDAAEVVAAPGHLALFGDGIALVADLHGGRIGRMWLLGDGAAGEPEPAVLVSFDPDLAQARGDLLAEAADHPALDPAHREPLLGAARDLVAEIVGDDPPPYRVRALLIRAWSDGARCAGLLAVYRLGSGPVRTMGWSYAAVLIDGDQVRTWRDRAGEAARTPWVAAF